MEQRLAAKSLDEPIVKQQRADSLLDGEQPSRLLRQLSGWGQLVRAGRLAAERADRLGAHDDRIQRDGAAKPLAGLGGQRHIADRQHDRAIHPKLPHLGRCKHVGVAQRDRDLKPRAGLQR